MAATIGEFNASIEAARRAAAMHPQSAQHQLQYASMIANAGRIQHALREGEAVLKLAPADPAVLHFLGTCYEELVADPEAGIPRILEHCGLEDEPGVRDFNKSSRPVFTASVAQVRSTSRHSWTPITADRRCLR